MKNKGRVFLLVMGITFIGIGIYRGEVNTIFTKAVNICLECVGIG